MLSRSRVAFVPLFPLGLILAVSPFAGSRLLPSPALATEQATTQAPAPADAPGKTIYVIVLGKDEQPITDLKPEEVRIFEDKAQQKITSVSLVIDEPLTIGLFFDVSGSRRADKFISEETKLTSELVHSIWHEGDTGFVLAFSSGTYVGTQPTHKLGEVDDGLSKIPDATYYGPTALYDALCILKADRLNATPGRKVYVAFSDFLDNSSRNKLENVIELAHGAKIAVFPVILSQGFGGGDSKKAEKRGRQTAQEIADKTGGEMLMPESHKELKPILERLAAGIRSTYRISYSPSSPPSDHRRKKLHIETTRPHCKVLFAKD